MVDVVATQIYVYVLGPSAFYLFFEPQLFCLKVR